MSNTSILEGIKAQSTKYSSNKQFVIKSKPNIKDNKQTIQSDTGQAITATPKDIDLFLSYLKQRSTRFEELLAHNAVLNQEEFCKKHLFSSVCIRTILKAVLDKMLTEKRLGRNLKGMNKSNMEEIQKHIWSSLEREVALYQNERKYMWERDQLKNDLQKRKRQILKEMENLSLEYQTVQKQLCLDQQPPTQDQHQNNSQNDQPSTWLTENCQKTEQSHKRSKAETNRNRAQPLDTSIASDEGEV